MGRIVITLCLMAGMASAETDAKSKTADPVQASEAKCDTCLARQNGKRALREHLAKKRAEEEAEAKDDD